MIDTVRWAYVFCEIAAGIPLEERLGIVKKAIDMYLSDEKERNVKGKSYEGRLYEDGRGLLGSFAGTIYRAELDTNKGKQKTSFIVMEKIRQELN